MPSLLLACCWHGHVSNQRPYRRGPQSRAGKRDLVPATFWMRVGVTFCFGVALAWQVLAGKALCDSGGTGHGLAMSVVPGTSAALHGVARTRTVPATPEAEETPAASNCDRRFYFTLVHHGFDEATMPVISGVAAANQTLERNSQATLPVPLRR